MKSCSVFKKGLIINIILSTWALVLGGKCRASSWSLPTPADFEIEEREEPYTVIILGEATLGYQILLRLSAQ